MANLIRLKQIESGSALQQSAEIGTDFSASVNTIVSQSLVSSLSQSIINIITNNVGATLPAGVVSGSSQIYISGTIGYSDIATDIEVAVISSSLSASQVLISSSISSLSSSVSSSNSFILSSSLSKVQQLANGQYSGSFIGDTVIYSPAIGGQVGYIKEKFTVGDTSAAQINLDATTSTRRIYIGTGTYNNANTSVYMDSAGKFSLKDKLTWDGTTLGVNGTINVTGGNAATDANALLYSQRAAASASISASAAQSNAASDATTKANAAYNNATGYGLSTQAMKWFWEQYLSKKSDSKNPYAVPAAAKDFSNLAPAIITTAEFDPLLDDGYIYAELLRKSGVQTVYREYEGMIHGYFSLAGITNEANVLHQHVADEINALLAR